MALLLNAILRFVNFIIFVFIICKYGQPISAPLGIRSHRLNFYSPLSTEFVRDRLFELDAERRARRAEVDRLRDLELFDSDDL